MAKIRTSIGEMRPERQNLADALPLESMRSGAGEQRKPKNLGDN